jgi:hypothetical protein
MNRSRPLTNNKNMKRTLFLLTAATSLGGVAAPHLNAQDVGLKIYTAIEVEFQTEVGKTYALQGSVGLTNWTEIGNPVFGNGQTEHRMFSTKDGGTVSYAAYRVQVAPGPTNGYAPWSIAGVQIRMEDQSVSNMVHFVTSTNGHDIYSAGDDSFAYRYARTALNAGHAERVYSPTHHDTLTYSYTGPGTGSWTREEYEQGNLKNRTVGAFRYLVAGTDPSNTNLVVTPTQPPAPPNSLTGLVYYAFTGPVPDKYQFNLGNSGLAFPGQTGTEVESTPSGNIFTYTYDVLSSNTASLHVEFGYYGIGGDRQEYDLTFTDGASAQFNRRIYRLGSLYTTDHGLFSPNATLPSTGATNTEVSITNAPPTTPMGLTFTMNIGQTRRLVFQGVATGIEFDDSAPSEFTYTYTQTGPATFSLVVRFKPDRWDEYDLTFANGAAGDLVERRYRNGKLDRTEAGGFSIALTGK